MTRPTPSGAEKRVVRVARCIHCRLIAGLDSGLGCYGSLFGYGLGLGIMGVSTSVVHSDVVNSWADLVRGVAVAGLTAYLGAVLGCRFAARAALPLVYAGARGLRRIEEAPGVRVALAEGWKFDEG